MPQRHAAVDTRPPPERPALAVVPDQEPDTTWWQSRPAGYRSCYESNRHQLDLLGAGQRGPYYLEHWRCLRCTTERLDTVDPRGLKLYRYFHPDDYKRPTGAELDRWELRLWNMRERRASGPKINLLDISAKFNTETAWWWE